jgi:hypothetical protein
MLGSFYKPGETCHFELKSSQFANRVERTGLAKLTTMLDVDEAQGGGELETKRQVVGSSSR